MSSKLFLVFALALLFVCANPASSEELQEGSAALDGMIFSGRVGPAANPDFDEELHFNQGLLWSKNCLRCGYQPGPYWTRRVGDRVHFISELKGRSGSTFEYQGVITEGHAEVSVRWTKQRWYWLIDRELIFRGTLAPDRQPVSAAEASRVANDALLSALPEWCP